MSLYIECVVNSRMDGNKTLSRLDCFETLHLSFASSKRLMRILRSIVGTQSLLVQSREANFAKRRSVGSEFLGNEALTSNKFPQQPHRRGLVALGLDQDFENLAFAVDSTPHIHLPSGD